MLDVRCQNSEVRGQRSNAGLGGQNQKSDVIFPPSDEGGGTRAARDGGRDRSDARTVGRGLAPAGKWRLVNQAVHGCAER